MPDYVRKAKVISSGLVKRFKTVSRAIYAEEVKFYTGEIIHANMDYATALSERSFYLQNNPDDWKEAERVAHSNYEQTKRLKKRIERMLTTSKNCVFLTFTFTDDVLAKTSSETRRQYVRKWLKQVSSKYVANIDFGGKNGREHYHGVCDSRVDPKTWSYGACNVQKVRYNPNDKSGVKLAKYVAKLTNHAIKETTKRCHLIYSRK